MNQPAHPHPPVIIYLTDSDSDTEGEFSVGPPPPPAAAEDPVWEPFEEPEEAEEEYQIRAIVSRDPDLPLVVRVQDELVIQYHFDDPRVAHINYPLYYGGELADWDKESDYYSLGDEYAEFDEETLDFVLYEPYARKWVWKIGRDALNQILQQQSRDRIGDASSEFPIYDQDGDEIEQRPRKRQCIRSGYPSLKQNHGQSSTEG